MWAGTGAEDRGGAEGGISAGLRRRRVDATILEAEPITQALTQAIPNAITNAFASTIKPVLPEPNRPINPSVIRVKLENEPIRE